MGGFKNQVIEVHFGGEKYEVELDPPIEVYRQVMSIQGKKLETDDDWNDIKELVATIICHGKPIDKKQFKESLTRIATLKFFNSYVDLYAKSSDLKNLENPLVENPGETEKK